MLHLYDEQIAARTAFAQFLPCCSGLYSSTSGAFLALKYLGKVVTPFETHPKTMQFAIGSLLVYCLAYGAELSVQSSILLNSFGRFMELFGSLSLASLASIFFPDPAQWVFFASCTIFWTGDFLFSLLQMVWKWMHRTVADRLLRLLQALESVLPQTSMNDSNEEITQFMRECCCHTCIVEGRMTGLDYV